VRPLSRRKQIPSEIRVGISGWRYKPWRQAFYPKGLPQKDELQFAGSAFNTIEINGSFYSLQRPSSYKKWRDTVPRDFIFAVKGPRFITHMKKLRMVEKPLANFFASGVLALETKLGPILWQFPPMLKYDKEKFEEFFKLLPFTKTDAVKLARKHDSHTAHRSLLKTKSKGRLRHAVEIRHESFNNSDFLDLLRKYQVAIVTADTAGKWPLIKEATSDFLYFRMHGDKELYASGYSGEALRKWEKAIKALSKMKGKKKRRDIFVYFDNDIKVHAPYDAKKFFGLLSKN
jgi:uncharacterized protein YecE (DUF72 family)